MTIPENAHRYTFSSQRLVGLMSISEEWNDWIKGTIGDIAVEISFEAAQEGYTLPGTNVTYLGMWRQRRKVVFEFQLGKIVKLPSQEDWVLAVEPLIQRLQGYKPLKTLL